MRWYADAAVPNNGPDTTNPAESQNAEPASEAPSSTTESKANNELEAKNKEIAKLKDNYLRIVADYRNLQDRTAREIKTNRDYALQGFVKDLMMSIDNIDHALLSVPAEKLEAPGDATVEQIHKDLVTLHKGFQLTERVLMDTLKKHGVTRYDPATENEKFDPMLHDAVFHAPQEGKANDTVFHTQQKGIMLNGRVLRAAQVGVVKNPS